MLFRWAVVRGAGRRFIRTIHDAFTFQFL
jgi:hypothetical protein